MDRARNPLTSLFRVASIMAGLALLSACNIVLTKDPLFTAADEAGAPALRPGVWIFKTDPDCRVDEAKPLAEWPDCAGGAVVSPGQIAGHDSKNPGKLEIAPFRLAAGDPRVAQLQVDIDMSANVSVSADVNANGNVTSSSNATTTSDPSKGQAYAYAGVRPTKSDDAGHITAFSFWPILCGPPAPKDDKGADTAPATLHPLPGIEMKPGDADCTTRSTDALRHAATASLAWTTDPGTAHWVRDGDH